MNTTKLSIEFHRAANSNLITDLAILVAKHNEGERPTDLDILQSYFKAYCSRYDYQQASTWFDKESGELVLFMKPGEPFISITEKIMIGSITEYEADLINQQNLS